MSAQVHYFRLGLFVVLGLALGAGALVLLGSDALFEGRGPVFETYLDESVEGLDVGSPVKYRGVRVGRVEDIDFVRNLYPESIETDDFDPFAGYVVVRVQLEPEVFGDLAYEELYQLFQREADAGLRVILTPKGLTGIAYLEIDYRQPEEHPPLEVSWRPDELYLPSTASTLRRFTTGVDEILQKLVETDIDVAVSELAELLSGLRETNERVHELLGDPAVGSLAADAGAAVRAVRGEVERLGGRLDATLDAVADGSARLAELAERLGAALDEEALERGLDDLSATLGHAREAAAELAAGSVEARSALRRLNRVLGDSEPDLGALAANLRSVSEHVKALSELAQRYPSLILFGEPPRPARSPGRLSPGSRLPAGN